MVFWLWQPLLWQSLSPRSRISSINASAPTYGLCASLSSLAVWWTYSSLRTVPILSASSFEQWTINRLWLQRSLSFYKWMNGFSYGHRIYTYTQAPAHISNHFLFYDRHNQACLRRALFSQGRCHVNIAAHHHCSQTLYDHRNAPTPTYIVNNDVVTVILLPQFSYFHHIPSKPKSMWAWQ